MTLSSVLRYRPFMLTFPLSIPNLGFSAIISQSPIRGRCHHAVNRLIRHLFQNIEGITDVDFINHLTSLNAPLFFDEKYSPPEWRRFWTFFFFLSVSLPHLCSDTDNPLSCLYVVFYIFSLL